MAEEPIEVSMTETECVMVQHALATVTVWNEEVGDRRLALKHKNIREKFIEAHEDSLSDSDD
jgi:hypothetical protein